MVVLLEDPLTYEELGRIIWLDLEKDILYGWENGNCAQKIESIIKGILLGDKFPPVFIRELQDGYLIAGKQDPLDHTNLGGHHRAIAHYRAKKPLKCLLLEGRSPSEGLIRNMRVLNLTVVDYKEDFMDSVRKSDPRYR